MTKELIEEARNLVQRHIRPMEEVARSWADASSTQEADKLGASATHLREASLMIGRLADALEAQLAARQPRESDREVLARTLFIASDDFAFADRMAKAWDAPGPHGRQRWYRYADAVLAAGFSRAAVPDAATEARIDRWKQLVGKGVEERMAAEAERDAALAAVERVRAAVNGPHPANSGLDSFTLAHISAALDGAPEPETVEHDYAIKYTGNDEHFRKVGSLEDARELADSTLGDVIMHRIKSRQVPAGPWLPVEGESK